VDYEEVWIKGLIVKDFHNIFAWVVHENVTLTHPHQATLKKLTL
jgi:hypothetical protein